jgi:hypothetical protein
MSSQNIVILCTLTLNLSLGLPLRISLSSSHTHYVLTKRIDEEYTVEKVVFIFPILKGMAEAKVLDVIRGGGVDSWN